MFRYLKNQEINKQVWDEQVTKTGALVYNYSWFLDAVCPGWSAIIYGNYEAFLPLPERRKMGINYVFPPFFAQQLGVFQNVDLNEFLKLIPKKIKYLELRISTQKSIEIQNIKQSFHQNFILETTATYQELHKNYASNTIRNLKTAKKQELTINENIPVDDFFEYSFHYSKTKNELNILKTLEILVAQSFKNKVGRIWGVIDKEDDLHCVLFWIETENRSYYLFPVSSPKGKESRAMFLLVNKIIQMKAEKKHIIDFEGSNIENIARFYKGFNAQKELYSHLIINNLPWPLNMLK